MYRQCDLTCSDLEIIAIQNDTKLPVNNKLVYFEGDDHLISQLAASGQIVPNYSQHRKRYTLFGDIDIDNTQLPFGQGVPQLSRAQEDDRLQLTKVLLNTQVDDTEKEPWMDIRIPKMHLRKDRATVKPEKK